MREMSVNQEVKKRIVCGVDENIRIRQHPTDQAGHGGMPDGLFICRGLGGDNARQALGKGVHKNDFVPLLTISLLF